MVAIDVAKQQRDRNANRQQQEPQGKRQGKATSATATEKRQGSNGGTATENREGIRATEKGKVFALPLRIATDCPSFSA
jgi:hypothetical protein